ncbi:MAG: hypothetical protein HJJLKODD_01218 [Phycisphaerae bacterium]|nr:hypothetical protein [Phycisphaerae bacterium]
MSTYKDQWEESYQRGDNHMFYPKEEVVKFMNRYVRKRIGINQFKEVLLPPQEAGTLLRGMDYGCGIGRMAILMQEFGLEAYGTDISEKSITLARQLAEHHGYPQMRERLTVGRGESIDYPDEFFDVIISEGVLDCMPHTTARKITGEISRVCKRLAYFSVDCGDNSEHYREYAGEEFFQNRNHTSPGTMHNYYNWAKVQELLAGTRLNIRSAHMLIEQSVTSRFLHSRYYVIADKIN